MKSGLPRLSDENVTAWRALADVGVSFALMKPPYWREWLVTHPARRCRARSKRAGRPCHRIATPGYEVCATHGSKSRGPYVTRWDCRPSAVQKKVSQLRAYWSQHGSGAVPPGARSTAYYAYELGADDITQLLAAREDT
jgi:hypothetical protein